MYIHVHVRTKCTFVVHVCMMYMFMLELKVAIYFYACIYMLVHVYTCMYILLFHCLMILTKSVAQNIHVCTCTCISEHC